MLGRKNHNPTTEHIREKRQAIRHERWKNRAQAAAWYGLLAEVFLLPLSPGLATAALLIGIAGTALRFYVDETFHFRHLRFDVPAVLFVAISGLSVLASPDRGFSFYNYYNLVGVYVLTYLLVGQNVRRPAQMKSILRLAAASAAIVIIYGYYQFLFGIDISSMKWVDGDAFPELRKRVFSTWENPNILAGYIDIVICLAFGLFVYCKNRERRIILGVFMLAAAACLAMTYARGACLVIAVILAGYGILKDRRVFIACVVVVAILFIADPVLYERITSVFTKVDTSTEMRLAFWESTIAMIQDHPFLGIGWGAYWMVYPEYDFYLQGANVLIVHAHNIYLNYMAEIGIPGAVAFFWFFFGTMILALRTNFPAAQAEQAPKRGLRVAFQWKRLWQDWNENELLEGLAKGIGLAVLSIALNGLTDDLLFNIPSSMVLWMLASLAGVLSLLSPPKTAKAKETSAYGEGAKKFLSGLTSSAWQNAKEAKDKVNEKVQSKVNGVLYREAPAEPETETKETPASEKAGDEAKAQKTAAKTESIAKASPDEAESAKKETDGTAAPVAEKPLDPMDELAEEVRKALLQRKQEEEAAKASAEAEKEPAAAPKAAEPAGKELQDADAAEEKADKQETKVKEAKEDTGEKKENEKMPVKAESAETETEAKEAEGHEEDKRNIKGDD